MGIERERRGGADRESKRVIEGSKKRWKEKNENVEIRRYNANSKRREGKDERA